MKSIRVAIAKMPQLMREIVLGTLSETDDIDIVGEPFDRPDLSQLALESDADVVIVACDASEVGRLGREVVVETPASLLAIVDQGQRGLLWELSPRQVDLGELTPGALTAAIRQTSERTSERTIAADGG